MNSSGRNWVLLYVKLEGCRACVSFEPHWQILVKELSPYATTTVLAVNGSDKKQIPGCLANYINWFPTILLMTAEEYEKYFTYTGTASGKCDLNIPADLYKYSADKSDFRTDLQLPMTNKAIEDWFSRITQMKLSRGVMYQ